MGIQVSIILVFLYASKMFHHKRKNNQILKWTYDEKS